MLVGIYETRPQHWSMDGAPWDYGVELLPGEHRPHRRRARTRSPPLSGLADGGHAQMGQRRLHLLAGRQSARRPGRGQARLLARLRRHGGISAGRRRRQVAGGIDDPWRGVEPTSTASTSPATAPSPPTANIIKQTTGEFYARRFVMTYPNEQLPAGRPLKMTPAYDAMTAAGCHWGNSWGLEVPLYFAPPGFKEKPTLKRSNAFDIVGAECRMVRAGVGLLDIASFSRYEVTGPEAERWLDWMTVSRLPKPGRARLAPMLSETGQAQGRPHHHQLGRRDLLDRGLLLPSPMAHALVRRPCARRGERARHFRRRDRLLALRPEIARAARARHPSGRVERRPAVHGRGDAGRRPRAGEGRAPVGDRRTRLRDQLPRARARAACAGPCSRPDGISASGNMAITRFCRSGSKRASASGRPNSRRPIPRA